MNSKYRKYDRNIPKYLLNRPAHFVKQCLIKISKAKQSDMSGVVMKSDGEFVVHSFQEKHEHYNVRFGSNDEMPSCSCLDWSNSMYLCKHFFAIFLKFPDTWSWNAVSSLYRNSPFLTMDEDMAKDDSPSLTIDEDMAKDDKEENNPEELAELKECEPQTEMVALQCDEDETNAIIKHESIQYSPMVRDVIGQLRNISYELSNEDSKELYDSLRSILDKTQDKRKREDSIPVLTNVLEYKTWQPKKYSRLSLNKKRKIGNARIGEKSEMMKKAKLISVEPQKKKEKLKDEIVEECVVDNIGIGEEEFNTQEIVFVDEASGDEEVVLLNCPSSKRSDLSVRCLRILSNNLMLTDNVVYVFQRFIKKQYPMVFGLQDTVLGQTLAYNVLGHRSFLQVYYY